VQGDESHGRISSFGGIHRKRIQSKILRGQLDLATGARRLQCGCREKFEAQEGRSVNWDHEGCVPTRGSEYQEKGMEGLAAEVAIQ
jgi:hypothetical protein